ncbi:hypothetical protein PILCRDRAFT_820855 [Piloderma croceum F 1598]|uniref:Uncharacterized protein n=1 Tax=Piloderma croceum (strain F 1598) TaxID=765440 RepID=A0A0C3FBA3_PILCF|nr:hypothetical protein PILCRDRAFT_820855 [Piloderma croceum F 1598]
MAPTGEPRKSPKPQPIGNIPIILLFTICTLCILFIFWRRADALRSAVSHQLKLLTKREGTIRLSIDDGPSSAEFLGDDDHDDHDEQDDNEPLADRAERLRWAGSGHGNADTLKAPTAPNLPTS